MSSSAGGRGKASGKRKAPSGGAKTTKMPAKKPRKPKGMPDFRPGETLVDLIKKQWKLGDLIGWGGFGALYYASPDIDKSVDDKATYVAKVEPHANGPLFGELAFYQRVAKEETINQWLSSKKLKHLGVPQYIGSGSHEKDGKKYRFMIMERYGDDVDQIFAQCSKCFHIQTVLTLAIRIIDILEYIHKHGYVHADIKGSNLMMGYTTGRKDQIFLVDYGLAYRFNPDGVHKEYKEDPKRRHDGTIEFTSRDAHKGLAPSRRADLEILGYVMLQWLCKKLPWEDNLADKNYVMNSKMRYMDNIPKLLKDCLKGQKSDELEQYLQYIVTLEYDGEPDYNKLRKIFQDGLRKRRFSDDGKSVKFKAGETTEVDLQNGTLDEEESIAEASEDDDDSHESPSPLKPRRKNAASKKVELRTKAPQKSESPVKQATASKKIASPVKPAVSRTRAGPRKASASQKKPVVKQGDEKPAKNPRGRPRKKPVMVDTATSP